MFDCNAYKKSVFSLWWECRRSQAYCTDSSCRQIFSIMDWTFLWNIWRDKNILVRGKSLFQFLKRLLWQTMFCASKFYILKEIGIFWKGTREWELKLKLVSHWCMRNILIVKYIDCNFFMQDWSFEVTRAMSALSVLESKRLLRCFRWTPWFPCSMFSVFPLHREVRGLSAI